MEKHNFLVRLLIVDSHSGKISHTKFWSNVGHGLACVLFAFSVYKGMATTELWFVFGTLVMGNATAHKLLNMRYSNKTKEEPRNDSIN